MTNICAGAGKLWGKCWKCPQIFYDIYMGKLGYASSFKQVGVFSPTVGLHNNLQKCELASFAFTWSALPSLELGSSKTYLMASQTTFLHYSCGYRKP